MHAAALALAAFLYLRSRGGRAGRKGVISFFILWFYVVLAPTSSFVPLVDVIFEHRLYLATLAYGAILALLLERAVLGPGGLEAGGGCGASEGRAMGPGAGAETAGLPGAGGEKS